jgi:hypothetical protein
MKTINLGDFVHSTERSGEAVQRPLPSPCLRWKCAQCKRCFHPSEPQHEWEDGPLCSQCDDKAMGWQELFGGGV